MDEELIYESDVPFYICWLSSGWNIGLTIFYGLGLLLAFIQSKSNHIRITTERVTWTRGLIAKKEEEVELVRVKDVSYQQNFLARIFRFGLITIRGTDLSAPTITMPIQNPKEWKEKIREAVKRLKRTEQVRYEERL